MRNMLTVHFVGEMFVCFCHAIAFIEEIICVFGYRHPSASSVIHSFAGDYPDVNGCFRHCVRQIRNFLDEQFSVECSSWKWFPFTFNEDGWLSMQTDRFQPFKWWNYPYMVAYTCGMQSPTCRSGWLVNVNAWIIHSKLLGFINIVLSGNRPIPMQFQSGFCAGLRCIKAKLLLGESSIQWQTEGDLCKIQLKSFGIWLEWKSIGRQFNSLTEWNHHHYSNPDMTYPHQRIIGMDSQLKNGMCVFGRPQPSWMMNLMCVQWGCNGLSRQNNFNSPPTAWHFSFFHLPFFGIPRLITAGTIVRSVGFK